MTSLDTLLGGSRYLGYAYSYPHKTAYRALPDLPLLSRAWAAEDRSALFLYLHVPFCEMRCGFCNLFTQLGNDSLATHYLDRLAVQAERVREAIGADARFARVAFGGGTPTFLRASELARLFDIAESFAGPLARLPVSLETSPLTATDDRLQLARDRGIDRISIGVQSFVDEELDALGRPSTGAAASAALERIRGHGFATLNVDLIYGARGQTTASFVSSLQAAGRFEPEEVYLYPLYVRPLTGLGRIGVRPTDLRVELYEIGRQWLVTHGYEQQSLRMFRRRDHAGAPGPVYCCQDDGMVGLGCGARSYTHGLHYAEDWAVAKPNVKAIVARWLFRSAESFDHAHYGIALSLDEQRRRCVIQSITNIEGLDRARYSVRFGADACEHFPELDALVERELLLASSTRIVPTAAGLAWADAIAPWLYSEAVRQRMEGFAVR